MHAVTIVDGALAWREHPDPAPGTGELLVRVRAAGVCRGDLMQGDGLYPPPPGTAPPDLPGLELAGEVKLQGFGHRVYKNYDPRATIIKQTADEVFAITGRNPLLDIALKLEDVALSDEYFTSRRLYPNVDFYSGLIYQAMDFPIEMFTVLFAIPRVSGWLAHWVELLEQDQKIARPRQLYVGAPERPYVPIDQRG